MSDAQTIMALLAILAEQSGERVSEPRLEFVARNILPLGAQAACQALEKLIASTRRFPTVQEIKDQMGLGEPTQKDLGSRVASVVVTMVSRIGVPCGDRGWAALKLTLGPAAHFVVERMGGWLIVLQQAEENLMALRAQVRDQAEAYFRTGQIKAADIPEHPLPYSQALDQADAEEKPRLPEEKRQLLLEHRDSLQKIRTDLRIGRLTDAEAGELIKVAEVETNLKSDQLDEAANGLD